MRIFDSVPYSKLMKQDFSESKTLNDALSMMETKGIQHQWYCHYTSLDKLQKMLFSKTMYLTRCSSLRFDDAIEGKKYGTLDESERRYIGCFSIGKPEIAAMWGLYCPPTYKAIRLVFGKKIMQEWAKRIEAMKIFDNKVGPIDLDTSEAFFSDLVYASVSGDDENRNRANTISWEGQFSKAIEDLEKQRRDVGATGRVKDYEWRFEREMRLIVSVREYKEAGERIAVRLPENVLKGMKFTLSPWADDDEKRFVREKVTALLKNALGTNTIDPQFEESVLSNGLVKWAESRGVS